MNRVLIVDDSATSRKLVSMAVEKLGYQIIAQGKDGVEAVTLFQEHRPDIVLLDITMPNKDGREALDEILKLDPKARVAMLTAIKSEEVIQECLGRGALGYILKANAFQDDGLASQIRAIFAA